MSTSLPPPWTATHQASLFFTISQTCSNSCLLSRWCHTIISSSVVPFSSCLLSFPASESYPKSRLFTSGGQSIGASASVLSMNIRGQSPLGWTGWISLHSKGLSRVSSNTTVQKHQFFGASLLYSPAFTSILDHWKNHGLFQFVVMHTVKGFSVDNEAEVDIFLEFSCFSYDPTDVGKMISDSPAFSKCSL